jgi:DNA repair exonuclease SbcCD ATPase subunit
VELVVKLANERLLVTNKSVSGTEQTVEVAHEALISNWSTLRNWVNEDREFLLWRERVDTLLAEWERVEGKEDALLRGSLLIEAQKWFDQRSEDLSDQERKFIAASRELRERLAREDKERQVRELESARKLAEARRRQRNFSIALVGLVLFVGLVASFAMWKWLDTQRILQNQYQVWKVKGTNRSCEMLL